MQSVHCRLVLACMYVLIATMQRPEIAGRRPRAGASASWLRLQTRVGYRPQREPSTGGEVQSVGVGGNRPQAVPGPLSDHGLHTCEGHQGSHRDAGQPRVVDDAGGGSV